MPAKANSGRSSLSANQTTSFFLVSGLGSGAYSAVGRHQAAVLGPEPTTPVRRRCVRMLVTGGPPVLGGGGMPQRIRTIYSSSSTLRTMGAG
jgi:hypothetical protein